MHSQARRRPRSNAARRAEPRGIGTAGARDPLAREVKLLGALLGQVIVEQEGEAALELVERVRKATIALRRGSLRPADRQLLSDELAAVDVAQAEVLIRAFSLYFGLTNLAEEKQRVRSLRRRARGGAVALDESAAAAVAALTSAGETRQSVASLVDRMSVSPVLTAHPTEARRRTMIVALRLVYRLLDALDESRATLA